MLETRNHDNLHDAIYSPRKDDDGPNRKYTDVYTDLYTRLIIN